MKSKILSSGYLSSAIKRVGYLEKVDMVGRGHRHRHFQKALLHLYNSYFSYLTLFLQQSSLPDPGIDLFIALIHL